MGMAEATQSAGSVITSPAKLAFAAYVLLAYSGKVPTSRVEIVLAAAVFVVVQIFHDDYLRIVLNRRAGRTATSDAA